MVRFTLTQNIDEDPFDWAIMDNEKDCLITAYTGKPVVDLLNAQYNEIKRKQLIINSLNSTIKNLMDESKILTLLEIEQDKTENLEKVYNDCIRNSRKLWAKNKELENENDFLSTLRESQGQMIRELDKENKELKKEKKELEEVIIDKVKYHEDNLEEFLIKKGLIKEDWARFDDYD